MAVPVEWLLPTVMQRFTNGTGPIMTARQSVAIIRGLQILEQ